MGLFWTWKKNKAAAPTPEPLVNPQAKEHPVHHTAPPAEHKPHHHPEHHPHPHPAHHPEPAHHEAPPPEHGAPHAEFEMRKLIFRVTPHEADKHALFVKEVIRHINKRDWHTLSGRIGKHLDGPKMRIDIKGAHKDIQDFIHWIKTSHYGVHAYEVVETQAHRFPYSVSSFPHFKELEGHWPTS